MRKNLIQLAVLILGGVVAFWVDAAGLPSNPSPIPVAETVVRNFQAIIVLHGTSQPISKSVRLHGGQFLFFQNRHLSSQLYERLLEDDKSTHPEQLGQFLNWLESSKVKGNVDFLALRATLERLKAHLPEHHPQSGRLDEILKELHATKLRFGREVNLALLDKPEPAKQTRPEWEQYVKSLEERYPVEQIVKELALDLPSDVQQAAPSPKGEGPAEKAKREEWSGAELPPKTILLTFDDGPHPKHTLEILEILGHYGIKAIFFQVGQNLGSVKGSKAELEHNGDVEKQILERGHAIGNHSYTHPFLPKLDMKHMDSEIAWTQLLVEAATPGAAGRTMMFRAPYGARSPMVMAEIGEHNLRSVLWNIDSQDWADPIPQSIALRVLNEAEKYGKGIVLFHDIHARTVDALPLTLDGLIKHGFHFTHWENGKLAVD